MTARSRPYAAAIGVLGTVVSLIVLDVFVIFILDLKLAWFAAGLVLVPPVCAYACGRRALFPISGLVPLAALTGLASALVVSATTAAMEKFSRMHADASWSKLSEWAHLMYSASAQEWVAVLSPATLGQWRQMILLLLAVSVSWFVGGNLGTILNPRRGRNDTSGGWSRGLPAHCEQDRAYSLVIGKLPVAGLEWLFSLLNAAGYGNG